LSFFNFNVQLYIIPLCLIQAGCLLGPNFHAPAPPKTGQYIQGSDPKSTISIKGTGSSGKAQHFLPGQDLPGQWWTAFHSPALNTLILTGLRNSPNRVGGALRTPSSHTTVRAMSHTAVSIKCLPTGSISLRG